ncbi:hypothetical protein LCGC14_2177630 [marine sediment metagenome]|uniref:Uncharacterized protein n=1 Tax=marine sediment metagenome TaxID=412755 RepID=A0A0F9DN83_9ZZZZ
MIVPTGKPNSPTRTTVLPVDDDPLVVLTRMTDPQQRQLAFHNAAAFVVKRTDSVAFVRSVIEATRTWLGELRPQGREVR